MLVATICSAVGVIVLGASAPKPAGWAAIALGIVSILAATIGFRP